MMEKGIVKTSVLGSFVQNTVLYSLIVVLALVLVFSIGNELGLSSFHLPSAFAMSDSGADSSGNLGSGTASPHSFTRGISESVSVASNFGGPSAAGRVYMRTVSDNVGVSAGFPLQNGSAAARTSTESSAGTTSQIQNGRNDERMSSRLQINNKNGTMEQKPNTKSGSEKSALSNLSEGSARCLTEDGTETRCADDSEDASGSSNNSNLTFCTFEILGSCPDLGAVQSFTNELLGGLNDYQAQALAISAYGAAIAVISVPLSHSRGRPARRVVAVIFGKVQSSTSYANRRPVLTILLLAIIFLSIPSSLYLPPAYGSTVKFGKVVGNHATDTFVADTGVASTTTIATYTRSDTGSTVYTVTKANLDQSLTGNVGNAVTMTFTFVQTITSTSGVQYQFESWTLGGSGWGSYTDGQGAVHCATNTVYTTLTDICASTNNGGGNTGGPVATYGFAASPSDTITVSPSATGQKAYGASVSQTLTVSDSITTKIAGRGISDSMTISDSIARSGKFTIPVLDSTAIADSITAKITKRTIADNVAMTDTVATKITGKGIADSTTITDSITAKITKRTIADNVAMTDTVATKITGKGIADLTTYTDSISTTYLASRSVSDSATITDSITAKITKRTISDSTTVLDSIAITRGFTRTESVTLSDSISRSYLTSRSINDPLTILDSVSTRVSRSITDTLTTGDAPIGSLVASRSTSNTVQISDDLAPTYLAVRSVSGTVVVSDGVTIQKFSSRSISDTVSISDGVTQALSASRSTNETATIIDSMAKSLTAFRSTADTITVEDTLDATKIFDRSVSDSVNATENIVKTISVSRSPADSVSIIGTAVRLLAANSSLSDNVTISEEVVENTTFSRSISDTLVPSDGIAMSVTHDLADTVVLADTAATSLAASRSVEDSISIRDTSGMSISSSNSDSLPVTDEVTLTLSASRSTDESATVSDSVSAVMAPSITDSMTISDSISTTIIPSITDSITVSESIYITVFSSIPDSAYIIDSITSTGNFSRSLSDTIAASDSISPTVAPSIVDSAAVSDNVSVDIAPSISDSATLSDSISITLALPVGDTLTTTDNVTTTLFTSHSTSDSLSLSDEVNVTNAFSREMSDPVGIVDTQSLMLNTSRSASDTVEISYDLAGSLNATRTVSDDVEVSHGMNGTLVLSRSISDELSTAEGASASNAFDRKITDSFETVDITAQTYNATRTEEDDALAVTDGLSTSLGRFTDDSLNVSDALAVGYYPGTVNETLSITDSIRTSSTPGSLPDSIAFDDFITTAASRTISDSLAISDGIGNPIKVEISDALTIDDSSVEAAVQGRAVEINDSIGMGAQLSEVSVKYNLNLGEPLSLQDCTPLSCNQALHFDEGLNLADNDFFTSPPGRILTTSLAVTDSIAVNRPQTFIPLNDSAGVSIAIKPLLPILVNDRPDDHGRPPSLSIPGNYTWDGTPASLRDNLKLEPLYFNTTVNRDNLSNQVVTLRLWNVNITSTAGLPANSTLISDRAANIPAGVPVQARINFKDTPSLSGHSNFIKSLDVQFTPAMLTTDFGLIVTPMDAPPGGAALPPEDLRPLYLDVKWWGNVPGGSDPSIASYYQHPPTFTFTVNDDWANSESAARDGNGVPIIKIRLLNETTNQWDEINAIQRPDSGKDGTYIFTATLPHFSDYVITAVKSAAVSPSPGSSHHTPLPVPQTFAVDLSDKLGVATTSASKAVSVIEEFAGEKFSANLLDSVVISSKPVAYNTFKILKGVEVSITVVDVKQESMVPPSATAVLQTEITNTGDEAEKFTLNYWYNDQMGKRGFDLSQQVEVEAHGKKTLQVMIPFTEPGSYRVTAEARSVPENNLLESTQLTVVVPWLSVYLFVLIAAIAAILGGSAIAIALYMARNGMMIATGTAGGAIILLGRKGKLRVRVAEKGTADGDNDDDYDLLVNVKLANSGEEGRLAAGQHTALFDFEIINKSTRKQEFVLAYHLVDVAGTVLPESVQRVKIAKRKTQIRNARLELLAGAYVLHVEARTAKGEVLSSNHVSVRTY